MRYKPGQIDQAISHLRSADTIMADLIDKQRSHEIAERWSPYRSVASWYCWRLIDVKKAATMDASGYPV